MTFLVRLWGQIAHNEQGTKYQEMAKREAISPSEIQGFVEELRIAVINERISRPPYIAFSHIDVTFNKEADAKIFADELGRNKRGVHVSSSGYLVVAHEFNN